MVKLPMAEVSVELKHYWEFTEEEKVIKRAEWRQYYYNNHERLKERMRVRVECVFCGKELSYGSLNYHYKNVCKPSAQ